MGIVLYEKLRRSIKNIRFQDLTKAVDLFGFELVRVKGDHHIFTRSDIPQALNLQPSKNNKAKPYQIKQFLNIIQEYELLDNL